MPCPYGNAELDFGDASQALGEFCESVNDSGPFHGEELEPRILFSPHQQHVLRLRELSRLQPIQIHPARQPRRIKRHLITSRREIVVH
jgi:hypothetical protein